MDDNETKTRITQLDESVTSALELAKARWLAKSEEERGAEWKRLLKSAQRGEQLVFHADGCTYMSDRVCSCNPAHVTWPGDKHLARA